MKYSIFRFSGIFIFILTIFTCENAIGQSFDSTFLSSEQEIEQFTQISKLDPNKSAIYSAILPGLGQAYNKQYWKIPIIYGTFLVLIDRIRFNNEFFHEFRTALIAANDNDPNTINPFENTLSTQTIQRNRDAFRRNRDQLVIFSVLFYFLNVVEAHVAAHLHEFQVNKSLSLNLKPTIQSTPLFSRSMGLSISLNF